MTSKISFRQLSEHALLAFLFLVILWKGGKSLDSVWAFAGASSLLSLCSIYLFWGTKDQSTNHDRWKQAAWLTLLTYTLLTIGSFAFSTTQNYGFDEVLQSVSLFLLFTFATGLPESFRTKFASTLAIALLIACVVGVGAYVLQPVSRFVGTFFDYRFHTDYWPNAWAEFVLLAWPMLVYSLFFRFKSTDLVRDDILKSAVLGVVAGCFFLSYSRGGVIAFIAQCMLLFGYFVIRTRFRLPWKRVGVILVLLTVVSSLVFLSLNDLRSKIYPIESVLQKITFTASEGSSSVSERSQFFSQSLRLAKLRPLIGMGPYSFRFVQPHLQTGVLATSDHPHNVFLKIAMERGIPALVLFLLFLFIVFVRGTHVLLRTQKGSPEEKLLPIFFVAAVGVLLHNLIDYNLQFVAIAAPLWMVFAFLLPCQKGSKCTYGVSTRWIVGLVSVVLLVSAFYEGTNLYQSSRARRAERAGDDSSALSLYTHALPTVFSRDAFLAVGAMHLNAGNFLAAQVSTKKYIAMNKGDARAWRLLGDIYLAWRNEKDAIHSYEKAFEFGKYNDAGILRGLIYTLLRGDKARLLERRQEFDVLLNQYAFSILRNVHFIALSSSVEQTVSVAELMARAFPLDAEMYKKLAQDVQSHAEMEREKYSSRPRGFLW